MIRKELKIVYTQFQGVEELSASLADLVEAARRIAEQAYSPYSGFSVGAAVLLADGTVITGNNQENAAYPSGLCAERTALFYANAQYPGTPVTAMAISATHEGERVGEPIKPCGSCRQVILETEIRFHQPITLVLDGRKRIFLFEGIDDLLPFSFKPSVLKE